MKAQRFSEMSGTVTTQNAFNFGSIVVRTNPKSGPVNILRFVMPEEHRVYLNIKVGSSRLITASLRRFPAWRQGHVIS
jgi:hypothetical protein